MLNRPRWDYKPHHIIDWKPPVLYMIQDDLQTPGGGAVNAAGNYNSAPEEDPVKSCQETGNEAGGASCIKAGLTCLAKDSPPDQDLTGL